MAIAMLTTIDNPYNPFDKFDEWLDYDLLAGHNCCAYLDRIAKTSDALSDAENEAIINEAIDEIIEYDPTGLYIKLVR